MQQILPFLILLFPLMGAFFTGIFLPILNQGFEKSKATQAGLLASFFIFLSFATSLYTLAHFHPEQGIISSNYPWLVIEDFKILFELKIDQLTSIMILVITAIGTLIHLFSMGYMHEEKSAARYFAYLNLFCFFMLLLVMSNSLPILFFGWEGVGLCSYLLIGFWYKDAEKPIAGEKAFIMNRVGDLFLLLGMFSLYSITHSLSFSDIQLTLSNPLENISSWKLNVTALLFIAGACGKSAQLPLHTWLPDAMMGPTPVSALIHAATMVTAGIYLIVRLHPLFQLAPQALMILSFIGAITAIMGASIALFQNDIKKILAYSTVSQLGLMFLACGVGAYEAAMFHLVTHAFFKALLFLGAGSIIHALSGEQDIQKMGNLRRHLPYTFLFMSIGSAALAGLPLFSGFFSKEEILTHTLNANAFAEVLLPIAFLTSFLTAIYSARLMRKTFFGKENLEAHAKEHLHESPAIMLVPLAILAVGATVAGFFHPQFSHWLSSFWTSVANKENIHGHFVLYTSLLIAFAGVGIGFMYSPAKKILQWRTWETLKNKYYIDEFYAATFVQSFRNLSHFAFQKIETGFFSGMHSFLHELLHLVGKLLRSLQKGDLQTTVLFMFLFFAVILSLAFYLF